MALHPVENVAWDTAVEVLWRQGLALPTEVQWEYAARAGTATPWWTGATPDTLAGAANLADRAYHDRGGPVYANAEMSIDDGYGGMLGWFWLACAVTTIVLVVVTRKALQERYYSAVMAATGLLYLAILTAFGTDLVARALLAGT